MDPAGPAADAINTIWWVMLAGATAIFLFVAALLLLAFRPRARRDASVRRWIVGGGLIFPGVVLTALLTFALIVGERLLSRGDVPAGQVAAESSPSQWSFTQPAAGAGTIRTQGVLHIPAGRPVDVTLTSRDVIHAFWVPRLAGKLDAIPGHRNVLRIEADAPGVYQGVCAEYCGVGHAGHMFRVVAHDAAGWARFQREGGA